MNTYESPLATRYGSEEMRSIFGAHYKYSTWRKLWVALAKAQQELGLNITDAQINQMSSCIDNIDYDLVAKYELEFHHDVIAHIYAFGDCAPLAKPIIHLGATSQFVVDNADFLIHNKAINLIIENLSNLLDVFRISINKYTGMPCLGYTHFQPAQPTTVAKRLAMWCSDIIRDLKQLKFQQSQMEFRGVKGTIGTQASFMAILGDHERVERLDHSVAASFGCSDSLSKICGQTYSRKIDMNVINALVGIAVTAHKICNDIRLLSHTGEICESFGAKQIGSSAMAYKRNPIKCEQTTSLARHLISLGYNQIQTAAEQWLERSLDDSANRRISIPEAFITADAIVGNLIKIIAGLEINVDIIKHNLERELPFIATENIIIEVVRNGGNRQEAHEKIRKHSMAAKVNLLKTKDNDLLSRLKKDPFFNLINLDNIVNVNKFVGLADIQATMFTLDMPTLGAGGGAGHGDAGDDASDPK